MGQLYTNTHKTGTAVRARAQSGVGRQGGADRFDLLAASCLRLHRCFHALRAFIIPETSTSVLKHTVVT